MPAKQPKLPKLPTIQLTRRGMRVGTRLVELSPLRQAVMQYLLVHGELDAGEFLGCTKKSVEVAVHYLRRALEPDYEITKAYRGSYRLKRREP